MHESKAPAKASPDAGRMALSRVVKGKIAKPPRVLVYGVEGVGKSTFAADAPSPIFLGAEDGTSELDTARFPEPRTWSDALEAVDVLTREEHDYRTLAIDTLDWLEPLCWTQTCAARRDRNGKPYASIEDFGYAKGYIYALDEWRVLLSALDKLRNQRGMCIVLIAHTWVKAFKNPAGDDFDRYEMKLHAKASGLIKEWADAVLFAAHEILTHKVNDRVKGISTGARIVHTTRTAAYDAKNRYDLPEELPLSWEAFAEAVEAHRPADPAKIVARIDALLERAPDDVRTRVRAAVKKANGEAAQLARIADKLNAMISIQTKENA